MKSFKKISKFAGAIVLTGFLATAPFGCVTQTAPNSLSYKSAKLEEVLEKPKDYENQPVTIEGIPYSVKYRDGEIRIFIKDKNDKGVFCSTDSIHRYYKNLYKIETIVEAEIRDGDNEPISISGVYKDREIIINSVKVEGYIISSKR